MLQSRIVLVCIDWSKENKPLSQPIRSEIKTNRDLLTRIFPRIASATFTLNFDWFTGLSVLFLIGQSGNVGFGFTSLK